MAHSTGYVFGFSAVVCVVCSLAVASTSLGLRDLQDTNKRRDAQSSILGALGLPENGAPLEGEAIDRLWEQRVELVVVDREGLSVEGTEEDRDADGDVDQDDVDIARGEAKGTDKPPEIVSVYQRTDSGSAGAYAIPVYGNGLWGPVSGFLAVGADGSSIIGATFFAPKETPGLGAEITEPKFIDQWKGKKIAANGQAEPIDVVKGSSKLLCADRLEHCVDGVSGATITSRGVDKMVEEAIDTIYAPYLARVRQGKVP